MLTKSSEHYYNEGKLAFHAGLYEADCRYIYESTHGARQNWLRGYADALKMNEGAPA